MAAKKLNIVTRLSGMNRALKAGEVKPATFEPEFIDVDPIIAAFRRQVRGNEFDICEMAITTYICAKAHGKPMTAIPTPIVRQFHHGATLVNTKSGVKVTYAAYPLTATARTTIDGIAADDVVATCLAGVLPHPAAAIRSTAARALVRLRIIACAPVKSDTTRMLGNPRRARARSETVTVRAWRVLRHRQRETWRRRFATLRSGRVAARRPRWSRCAPAQPCRWKRRASCPPVCR